MYRSFPLDDLDIIRGINLFPMLFDLLVAHFTRWEPYYLLNPAHVSWVGSAL